MSTKMDLEENEYEYFWDRPCPAPGGIEQKQASARSCPSGKGRDRLEAKWQIGKNEPKY